MVDNLGAGHGRVPHANQPVRMGKSMESPGSRGHNRITMAQGLQMALARLLSAMADVKPQERKAAALAFACNFVLLGSYYILRPLRDTMATIFGVAELQNLFTGTFILIFLCSPLFSWFAARTALSRLLPGVFWFLLSNLLIFYILFNLAPYNRWVAAAFVAVALGRRYEAISGARAVNPVVSAAG